MDFTSILQRRAEAAEMPPQYKESYGKLAPHAISCLVVLIVFLSITVVFTGLRLYSRWLSSRRLFVTDWTFLVAEVFYIAYTAISIVALYHGGIGYHLEDLGTAQVQTILKLLLAVQITYALCMSLLKISICLLYAQIFTQKWVKISVYILMGLSAAWALMTILIGVLICKPISAQWDPLSGTCGDQNAGLAAVSGVELVIDAFIILLPLPVVWSLRIATPTKVATTALFGLGIITIVITGYRLHIVLGVDFADFTYASTNVVNFTVVELGVAVVVTSSLGLRHLLDRVFKTSRWRTFHSTGRSTNLSHSGARGTAMDTLRSKHSQGFETILDTSTNDDEHSSPFHHSAVSDDSGLKAGEHGVALRGDGIVVTSDFTLNHEHT